MPLLRATAVHLLAAFVLVACLHVSISPSPLASALDYRISYTYTNTTGLGTLLSVPPTAPNVTLGRNSVTKGVPLGFTFSFYGQNYTAVNVSTSGNLQFQTASITGSPYVLPSAGAAALQPLIAYFFYPMFWQAPGTAQYATLGASPYRVWVLSLRNMTLSSASSLFSIDVELYETTNVIVVRYISMPYAPLPGTLQIGVSGPQHPDFTTEYTVLPNFNAAVQAPMATLNNTVLTFTPSAPVSYVSSAPPLTPVFSGTYNATLISNVGTLAAIPPASATSLPASSNSVFTIRLGFTFWFYGANFTTVMLSTNGVLEFATVSSTADTDSLPTSSTLQSPFVAFAFANWNTSVAGMITYSITGSPGSNVLRIRYNNVPHSVDPSAYITCDVFLYEADSSIEVRYSLVPNTNNVMVVGIQSSSPIADSVFDFAVVLNNLALTDVAVASLTNSTVRFAVVNASIALNALKPVAKSFNSTTLQSVVPKVALPGARTLEGSNDNTDFISFGFPFWWGGIVYSGAYLTTNGELQFASAVAQYQSGTLLPSATRAPLIAFFYTDLFPLLNAERYYLSNGTYPNRVFTLRHDNVPYATTAATVNPPSVSLDVVLFESDYHVEVRYYNVSLSAQQTVTIGAQASSIARADGTFDTLALIDNVLISSVASSLAQSTWVLRPTNAMRLPLIGTSYTAVRTTTTPPRITLPSSFAVPLSGSRSVPAGMPIVFSFYNVSYSVVSISPYGYLQFGRYTGDGISVPTQWPSGALALAPVVAIFHTNFDVTTLPTVTVGTIGTAPYRSFVIQYRNFLPVYSSTFFNADVLLNETKNAIEIRYYSVPTETDYNVAIGVMGSPTINFGSYDLTVVANAAPMGDALQAYLTSSSLVFVPTATSGEVDPYSYNVTAVQLASNVPPTLAGLTVIGNTTSVAAVPLGFLFMFYAQRYSFVRLTSNGVLQFTTNSALVTASQMPLFDATTLPALAFFWTALYLPSAQSWGYVTSGAFPNRVFTLRLTNVQYATERFNSAPGTVSLDLQLFEYDSHISVSYYSVSTSAQSVAIGIQGSVVVRSDYTHDYTTWANFVPLGATVVNALSDQRVDFWPTIVPPPAQLAPLTPVSVGSYYATHSLGVASPVAMTSPVYPRIIEVVENVPLGFNFTFFDSSYMSVAIASYGNLQFKTARKDWNPRSVPGRSSDLVPYIAFAFAFMVPVTTGLVSYQTLGTSPSQYFVVRFDNVTYFGGSSTVTCDVLLFQVDNSIEIRFYAVDPQIYRVLTVAIENAPVTGQSTQYAAVVNCTYVDPLMAATLSFSTVRFQLTGGSDGTASGSSLSDGIIAGVVIGVTVVLVAILAALLVRRARSKASSSSATGCSGSAASFFGRASSSGRAQLEESRSANAYEAQDDQIELTDHSHLGDEL